MSTQTPAGAGYWPDHYHRHLHHRLVWTRDYVRERPPDDVVRHFDSFLALLQQARRYPDLHPSSADLVADLAPWSRRWGNWDDWKAALEFAAREFARQDQPQRQAEMLSHLAALLQLTGQIDQAVATGEQALALARAHRAAIVFAQAGMNLVLTFRSMEQPEQARALRQELAAELALMFPHVPARDLAVANAHLGLLDLRYLRDQGRLDEAVAEASRILAALEALEEQESRLLADVYSERAILYWSQDDYARAIDDLDRAIQIALEEGDPYAAERNYGNLGLILWSMSEYDRAEEAIRQRIAACERENNRWFLAQNVGNLGLVYLARGDLETAMLYLERHLAMSTRLKDTSEIRRARGNRGIVRMCQGEYQAAVADLETWIDFAGHTGARGAFAVDSLNLSHCYAQLGQVDRAIQITENVLQIARESGSQVIRGLALRHLADYGPAHERAGYLQQALEIAREYRRRLDEADCLLALAGLAQDSQEQARLWEQGVAILTQIGATAWLESASPDHPPHIPATGV